MSNSVMRDENVRLANGKICVLDASEVAPGKYEIMLFRPRSGECVDSVTVYSREDIPREFRRLYATHNTAAPV